MTEMKGPATSFAQLDTPTSLHSRVIRALALRSFRGNVAAN